jgi:hypothetical protein
LLNQGIGHLRCEDTCTPNTYDESSTGETRQKIRTPADGIQDEGVEDFVCAVEHINKARKGRLGREHTQTSDPPPIRLLPSSAGRARYRDTP